MKAIGDLRPMIDEINAKRLDWKAQQIAKHGWPVSVECVFCGDVGILPDARDKPCLACEKGRAIADRRQRETAWLQECPRRFRDYTLDTHPRADRVAMMRDWLDNGRHAGMNLVLFSAGPGTGKTGLAIGALRELSIDGVGVKFGTAPDLLDELRPRGDRDDSPARNLATMQRVPVLVMDDIGMEKVTEWVAERIYLILNGRYENGLPTIVTTNRTIADLPTSLGDRIVSRLMESAVACDMSGADIRRARPMFIAPPEMTVPIRKAGIRERIASSTPGGPQGARRGHT